MPHTPTRERQHEYLGNRAWEHKIEKLKMKNESSETRIKVIEFKNLIDKNFRIAIVKKFNEIIKVQANTERKGVGS